ncbi:hypothetical protein NN3_49340 [Nocardia neocaledoniensis NBRC 108232]|uniref:Uncharacterized protein DUF1353 n=1 Tax=Nocardia neocaledoniensis TaxID=236511 RepID=A0A317N5N4_9NOCA|nr:DUF1353 domain-containing protein [Nocardia neocaledoniensis]PWV70596.1 uncharacterized protein DUF1353 [Nocardia neocaledoniensis]GEM33927.1 hypothetical protein NN3_49340 [Nocardia neocaledoniensis NBRC 108232]
MAFIGGGPVVEELDAKFWRLTEPLTYRGAVETFTVPAGFRTDFASVPRALVWLIPRYGAYTRAAILHDYLCRTDTVGRADADGLFRRCLREFDVSVPRRWMMWAAVRLGSGLRGATPGDVARWLLIAVPSIVFLALPVAVVTVALWLFWVVELVFWAIGRLGHRSAEPPPTPQMKTA